MNKSGVTNKKIILKARNRLRCLNLNFSGRIGKEKTGGKNNVREKRNARQTLVSKLQDFIKVDIRKTGCGLESNVSGYISMTGFSELRDERHDFIKTRNFSSTSSAIIGRDFS
jgi:hypothetical protein